MITLHTVLKTHSDGVLEGHMHIYAYIRANLAINANLFLFVFHQVSGSSSPSVDISCMYMAICDNLLLSFVTKQSLPQSLPSFLIL